MKTMITRLHVIHDNGDFLDDRSTSISIDDEGGGKFIRIEQPTANGGIAIEKGEWQAIRDALEQLMKDCDERI